jgi:hypothetical protein
MWDLYDFRRCMRLRRRNMALCTMSIALLGPTLMAQDTPLISGGAGFFTSTNAGSTSYQPIAAPVLEAPVGQHLLIESRANLVETFSPRSNGEGYDHSLFLSPAYLQADYIATPHLTLVGGYFLTPFGTYNERLAPIWIADLGEAPLIFSLGTMGSGSGLGGMARGNAFSSHKISVSYAAYFSAGSTNKKFSATRSTGGQVYAYFPEKRLEIGASYGRLLDGKQTNSVGGHLWWEPAKVPLKIRSEYAHGAHSQGYWLESDYRLSQVHGADSAIGRLELAFRLQQTFRESAADRTDFLPAANTQRTDFGLDYYLPHEVRINASYARQFSSTGNFNVWDTGIVYRFLFPTWRGK